ncbi:ABC transporter permease [Brevibacterium litoralis]|uniref:ABC transporter permease n=1 Tax=Brevibacterium litoralis TaxID=3138935 RepID=UPI0032EFCD06
MKNHAHMEEHTPVADLADLPAPAPAWRRVAAQTLFEARAVMRNGEQLLLSIILPVIALLGLSLTRIPEVLGTGSALGTDSAGAAGAHSPVAVALAGVLGLAIASTAFTGQAIATGFDRRYGVLRHLATTPLGTTGLVLGKLCAVYVVVLTQYVVLGGIALVLGFAPGSLGVLGWVGLVLAAVLGTAVLLTWALVMAGTLRAEATLALANIVWVLMAVVGGILVPHAGLWGTIVSFLPFGALGEAMRAAVLDGRINVLALVVLAVWAVIGLMVARRFFRWSST